MRRPTGAPAGPRPAAGESPSRPVEVVLRDWGWRPAGRRRWALRGVDLRLTPGERVLLLGPSGAGKSTLLAALAGLLEPAAGEPAGRLLVDGADPARVRHRIGFVAQDPESALVMGRSGDDVAFGLENRAVPRERIWPRVDEALAAVGFGYGRDRPTSALSGGEQQRLVLAGVLATRPGLLLLDEPTANLDPAGAGLVRAALGRVLDATGATLVLVEHRVAESLHLVDRVVVLGSAGEGPAAVLADGPPDAVFAGSGQALAAAGVWLPGRAPRPPRRARAPGNPVSRPVLEARGLRLRPAQDQPVLALPDLAVAGGEVLAVTGPNGAGKSTLALLAGGLLAPHAGQVALADRPERPLHRWPARELVRRVGSVFQDPEHQFLRGRVDDELALGPLRAGRSPAAAYHRAGELLERLRLAHLAAANPYTLSGGEKRRLSVATALSTSPDLLVLDEPTFGQDARTWAELVDLLDQVRTDGRAVLTVTHDAPFVAALADRVLSLPGPGPTVGQVTR